MQEVKQEFIKGEDGNYTINTSTIETEVTLDGLKNAYANYNSQIIQVKTNLNQLKKGLSEIESDKEGYINKHMELLKKHIMKLEEDEMQMTEKSNELRAVIEADIVLEDNLVESSSEGQ